MRRFLVALALVAWAVSAFARGGGPVVVPPSIPAWQQSCQTFAPNAPVLGSNNSSNVYNATRLVCVNGPIALTAVKIVVTNSSVNAGAHGWNTSTLTNSSSVALSSCTYSAYVEYPLGTMAQSGAAVQWTGAGGTSSLAVSPALTRPESDAFTLSVPANALYAVQLYAKNGGSGSCGGYISKGTNNPIPHYSASNSTSEVETGTSGDSPDIGTAGNWPSGHLTTGATAVSPLEVLGQLAAVGSQHAVLIEGDSHADCQTDSGNTDAGDSHGFCGFPMRALDRFANVPPFICVCIGSREIAAYANPIDGDLQSALEASLFQDVTNIVDYNWPNDAGSGSSSATIEGEISKLADDGSAVGVRAVFSFRSPPQTTSADNWESANANGGYGAQTQVRGTGSGGVATVVNSWLATGKSNSGNAITMLDHVSGAHGIGDACTPGLGLTGASSSDPGFGWCSDGVHQFGSTGAGLHPFGTGSSYGITATDSTTGCAYGNSYCQGAYAAYVQGLNPSATAYGALQ